MHRIIAPLLLAIGFFLWEFIGVLIYAAFHLVTPAIVLFLVLCIFWGSYGAFSMRMLSGSPAFRVIALVLIPIPALIFYVMGLGGPYIAGFFTEVLFLAGAGLMAIYRKYFSPSRKA